MHGSTYLWSGKTCYGKISYTMMLLVVQSSGLSNCLKDTNYNRWNRPSKYGRSEKTKRSQLIWLVLLFWRKYSHCKYAPTYCEPFTCCRAQRYSTSSCVTATPASRATSTSPSLVTFKSSSKSTSRATMRRAFCRRHSSSRKTRLSTEKLRQVSTLRLVQTSRSKFIVYCSKVEIENFLDYSCWFLLPFIY